MAENNPFLHRIGRFAVINPAESAWFAYWDLQVVLQLIFTAFLIPYDAVFIEPRLNAFFWILRAVDAVFLVDTALQFLVAFPDPARAERVVKDPMAIWLKYFKGGFAIDLLGVLPVEITFGQIEMDLFAGKPIHSSLTCNLRLLRLLRLARFPRLVDRWRSSFGFSYAKTTIIKFLGAIVLSLHWAACLWSLLALQGDADLNWLLALRNGKGGAEFMYEKHWGIYTLSLYWSLVSLACVGYGDITPQSQLEYCVTACVVALMASLWAYFIGAVCHIVAQMPNFEQSFARSMDDLNVLMDLKEVPDEFRFRLRKYFYESRELHRLQIESRVVANVSPMLQGECAMEAYGGHLSQVWYLQGLDREALIDISRCVHLKVYAASEEIKKERTIHIVQRGICATGGLILTPGKIWGEDMLLENQQLRSPAVATALSHLSVLTLSAEDLEQQLEHHPVAQKRIRRAKTLIAVRRGFLVVRRAINAVHRLQAFSWHALDDRRRKEFAEAVLQGLVDVHSKDSLVSFHNGLPFRQPEPARSRVRGGPDVTPKQRARDSITAVLLEPAEVATGQPPKVGSDQTYLKALSWHSEEEREDPSMSWYNPEGDDSPDSYTSLRRTQAPHDVSDGQAPVFQQLEYMRKCVLRLHAKVDRLADEEQGTELNENGLGHLFE